MKTLYIPVKSKLKLDELIINDLSKKLPKNIAIAYSIQFKDIAFEIKNQLKDTHDVRIILQVLGCSNPKFSKEIQAILLISNGKFHAVSLAYETNLPVFLLDHNKLEKISNEQIENMKKNQKASYVRYLSAKNIGILVSTKPGQENLKQALDFKNNLKDKKAYLFIANNLNTNEFENFNIDSWVNTACPRMDLNNNKIINLKYVRESHKIL